MIKEFNVTNYGLILDSKGYRRLQLCFFFPYIFSLNFPQKRLRMKKKAHLGSWDSVFITMFCVLLFLLLLSLEVMSQSNDDGAVMDALRKSIGFKGWSGSDYCSWQGVSCDKNNRVYKIQLGNQNLQGTLPPDIKNLSALEQFEVQKNQLSGDFPSFSGLSSFRMLLADGNNFSSFPADYFNGLSSLETISINNNAFSPWTIPDSLKSASALKSFSATSANLNGKIPDLSWGNAFPSLIELKLSFNNFEGELPASFSGSSIQTLWLNGLKGTNKLNGSISIIQNMTSLQSLWLHGNQLTGPIPDLSNLQRLSDLSLRDNQLTGVVPSSLVNIPSLQVVNLTNNLLQGPTPVFKNGVMVDMKAGTNSFCLDNPGEPCDTRVDILLSIVKYFNYPVDFASSWQGNDPCGSGNSKSSSGNWKGITCIGADITTVNFGNMGLVGTISSNFSMITSLKRLILFNNNIDGTIPNELTTLPNLVELDVSNNKLYGKMPSFRQNVVVKTSGNPNIGKDRPVPGSPGSGDGNDNKSRIVKVIGVVLGSIGVVLAIGTAVFCLVIRKRRQSGRVQSPNSFVMHSGNQEKIAVHGCGSDKCSSTSSGHDDLHLVEGGNMTISIHVLRNVTGNFSQENILGTGGFGTVYKGELHDGTNIAVKRMESGVVADKGLKEFKSEISVLTKVRHRHLVALLDYCLDGNEKLLVYEYMPQGTLSRFLFHWKEEGLKPLEWSRRLTIGLEVARGVEYLHGLAAQSFIHRDLKPSNILLDDDMRAKVADFGLVRLAPEGKASIETRLAGTFGYLAPEYAATGRVTTKVDVYSFGVILMELITGRKAIDESEPEESLHLVTWFRRMILNKDKFQKAIDPAMDLNEETLISITKVAQLAGHCTAREPHQRPDMGHTVNVLASLVNVWKPSEPEGSDDTYGINLDMTLPQALKKWQASGGDESSFFANMGYTPSASDNTQSSMPEKHQGLAKTFGSSDGR